MTTITSTASEVKLSAGVRSKKQLWIGRVLSAVPVLMMTMSVAMKLSRAPGFVTQWTEHLGYPEGALTGVALVELACVALYAFPRTAVLGAAFMTAYLGGAVATHVRIGEPFVAPVVIGVLAWVGLYLRDERLRALAPLRTT